MVGNQRSPWSTTRRDFLRSTAAVAAAGCLGWQAGTARAATADGFRLGCFTRPFPQFSFAETVDAVADAGFQAIGLMAVQLGDESVTLVNAQDRHLEQIRDLAAGRGLAIAATYYGGPPVQESMSAGIEQLRRVIDNCHATGCENIVLGGTEDAKLVDPYFDAIAACCDYAAAKQVTLVLKPHGGFNATGPQCRQIVTRVNHPALRVWYDPGNIWYYSDGRLDPLDDYASVAGLVTGMCIKDYVHPKKVDVNPGDGQVDFPKLMAGLRAGGFNSGLLVVETLAEGDRDAVIRSATAARQFLSDLIQG